MLLVFQTHHSQCLAQKPTFYQGIDCCVFESDVPRSLALSVLVVVEMLNAINR